MDKEKQKNNTGTLNRRDFLKALSAIGGAAVISSGCTPEPLDKLVSYAVPPDNVIPGIANYYTSVIPNSPVGTPVVVRVREGGLSRLREILTIQLHLEALQLKIRLHYKLFMILIELNNHYLETIEKI